MNSRRMMMRATEVEDAELLRNWYLQKELMKHVGYPEGLDVDIEKQRALIQNQKNDGKLLILTLLDGTPIGECHYFNMKNTSCEIGIKICDLNYHGQGYGKEGLQLLLSHLFGVMGIKTVFLDTLSENNRAQNLYKSVGFKETGIKKACWTDPTGKDRDAVLMTLTLEDFKASLNILFKMN